MSSSSVTGSSSGSMDNYHVLEHIGEGSFGKVYKARRKNTGFTVAMKFITKHGKSEKDLRNLRQEIRILRKLKHENIILMFDAFETEREFCVVTEYAQVCPILTLSRPLNLTLTLTLTAGGAVRHFTGRSAVTRSHGSASG